jgi:cohesin loading factor subunit SCC2
VIVLSHFVLKDDIKDQVCDTLAYFVRQPNEDIQLFTLKAIGSLCIRHYDFMLGSELKTLYHRLLTEDDAPLHMRTQVNSASGQEEMKLCQIMRKTTFI